MPKLVFLPDAIEVDVKEGTKILAAALKNKIAIRYGCGACQCGTCGVKIDASSGKVVAMKENERALLTKLGLGLEGDIRLACQTKVLEGTIQVDLDFQEEYSP